MADVVSQQDVIAYRLTAHNLAERRDANSLLDVAGACGIQNSPPGSALLALHARMRDLTSNQFDDAVADEKSLLQTWSMRGAPFYFPTADAPVFTTGVLPPTEDAIHQFLPGLAHALDRLHLTVVEAVELCRAEIGVLSGRWLDINELGTQLARRIAPQLSRQRREAWEAEGPYAAGQPLGEAVVHFCVRVLALQRVVCFAPRIGNRAPFVLVDEWLGRSIPDVDPANARTELLRRYLHCYGPSTRSGFAAWLGVRAGDVDPWWTGVEHEMAPVEFGGRAWLLTADLEALRSATLTRGVRLLPPRDPYTQLRDRESLRLEAEQLGPLRGAASVAVEFDEC